MTEEILVNVTPVETRVAVVENGMLQEVYIERSRRRGIVGNIYKGVVVRVLPGMEAAFVDIGLERAAFIHVSELTGNGNGEGNGRSVEIGGLLREGQELVVQVTKDPIGTKGARLTTHLSIPSRYLVYMPGTDHIGISQRIENEMERERLKLLIQTCVDDGLLAEDEAKDASTASSGFIIRTAAEGVGSEEFTADIMYLRRLWRAVYRKLQSVKPPAVVYEDLSLYARTLRDLVRPETEKIRIDSKEGYQRAIEFTDQFVSEIKDKIEYYPGERPIFDLYGVEDEIQKALGRKVQLKSGGYLIIDQTEAMTTIDVNTGGFVGHKNLEETIFKTNLEATRAIARQLRLRNLGGIIILDLIDMTDPEHNRQVLRMLEKMLERDHAKTKISCVSELGLVEMTRKRTTESLGQMLSEACPACEGRGTVKTPETLCYEIFREILRINRNYDAQSYLVMASQQVVDLLLDDQSDNVADLEEFIGKSIRFQVEVIYTQEQFDVVLQ
ncbi:ribonuclease G [Allohahella marinimesophila]|uniref:Ribonuclease G n=1 Tax=Allohahella marinimesophila TaxID=1054972 RepID=A0ABP7PZ68_9GAMM